MRALLSLAVVMVSACGNSPPPGPNPCQSAALGGGSDAAVPFNPGPKVLGLVGVPFEIDLAQLAPACPVKNIEVFTEVTDPSNRPVPHTHSDPAQVRTTVKFTPTLPGEYHVSARFEPSLGSTQLQVLVAADKSKGLSKTYQVTKTCASFEAMPSGLALCFTSNGLEVFRDGATVQPKIPGYGYAVAGNVLWVVRQGAIERRTELAGGLSPAAVLPVETYDTNTTLIAREDSVLMIGDGQVLKVNWQGGALLQESRTPFPHTGTDRSVASADLKTLLTLDRVTSGIGSFERCVLQLNTQALGRCDGLPPGTTDLIGVDATGVWSLGNATVRVDGFDAAGTVVSATAPSWNLRPKSNPLQASRHFEQSPVFEPVSEVYASPRFTGSEVVIEAVKLESGFSLQPGSASLLRIESADGRQTLISR